MDYPSTTQALFALIVMITVLAFILVYCCWGTFSCPRPGDIPCSDDRDSLRDVRDRSTSSTPPAFFILPYRNMIYVGDGRTQRVFQIPINDDKPPSYTELFANASPPDYRSFSVPSIGAPPTYEQCLRYGNTALMIGDSRANSQNNIENVSINSLCILSPTEHYCSSSSLRDSPTLGDAPFYGTDPKLFASIVPSIIKNWGSMSPHNGQSSQSTYLPPSLVSLPSNACCSNPCLPTTSPVLEHPPPHESLHYSAVPSSHIEEILCPGESESSLRGSDDTVGSKTATSTVEIPAVNR